MSDVGPDSEYERLDGLLNDLSANGFDVSLDQRIRVMSVLLAFRLSMRGSRAHHRLRYLLGPVLCRSAEEQEIFGKTIGHWFPQHSTPRDGEPVEINTKNDKEWQSLVEERRAFEEEATRRLRARRILELRRQLRVIAPMFVVFFVLSIGIQFVLFRFVPHQTLRTETSVSSPLTIPQAPKPPPSLDPRTARESPSWFRSKLTSAVGRFTSVSQSLGPFTTLFLMVPLALIALAIASSRKLVSAYARQTRMRPRDEMRRLFSGGRHEEEFVNPAFFRDIQPMRRSIELPSSEIDLERTIEATVAAGGYFTPVFGHRRASPEYLVLVDRQGAGDHYARYSLKLVNALVSAGVYTATYLFRRDPRRIVLQSSRQYFDLEDLVHRHPYGRLIIFSDGAGLFDFANGELQPWTRIFSDWAKAILLTPKEPLDWGRLEFLIETQLNMPVLPTSEVGLSTAAIIFENNAAEATVIRPIPLDRFSDLASLTSFLAVGTWQWVDDMQPAQTSVDRLEKRLLTGLSAKAVDWLRALAVYPKIYWSLTMYIGQRLYSADDPGLSAEAQMREIFRLPWLTFGHMPNWLRRRLVEGMPADLRNRVHQILEDLLVSVTSRDPKKFAMSLDLARTQSPEEESNRVDREELSDDQILIDFMTGREAKAEDFRLRSRVARALGIPLLGSGIKSLFSRSGLKEIGVAAKEVTVLVPSSALTNIRFGSVEPEFGLDAFTAENICDSNGNIIECPFRLYLVRLRPIDRVAYLVDEASLKANANMSSLFLKFSVVSFLIVTSVLVTSYIEFFNKIPTLGIGCALLCVLIYFPFFLFWILLRRPYIKALKEFPQIRW
jgi:hypothetical protein